MKQTPSKRCPDCGMVKLLAEFPRNKRTKDGWACYCKKCHNRRGRESRSRYGGSRHHHLSQRYGMTPAEFEERVKSQGGLCAICRRKAAVQVDHDHETGIVRGVLCLHCNAALGALRDDLGRVYMAIDYLETANNRPVDLGYL